MESGTSSHDRLITTRMIQAHYEAKDVAKRALRDALHSKQCWTSQLIQLLLIVACVTASYIGVRFVADRLPMFDTDASNTFSIILIGTAVATWLIIARCPLTFVNIWKAAYWDHVNNVIRCIDV